MFEIFEDQHNDEQGLVGSNNQIIEPTIEPVDDTQTDELIKKLDLVHKKLLPVKPIDQELKQRFQETLGGLVVLKEEILHRLDDALTRSALIKEKVDLLLYSGKVQVDEEEYKNSETSVHHYAQLLHNIVNDIEQEIQTFSGLIADTLPSYFVVSKEESDVFTIFIEDKIKALKKYIKNIRKDLNVSDSRYRYGFDAQMKRITYIERFVAAEEQKKSKN
jgi:hypothetical protein